MELLRHKMEDSGYGRKGHMHAEFSTGGSFTHNNTVGHITFAGSSIVMTVDGVEGHFHIDYTQELEALVDSIEAGEY